MDSECNSNMLEEGSYQLVFVYQENVDYKVQKLILNLEHFLRLLAGIYACE